MQFLPGQLYKVMAKHLFAMVFHCNYSYWNQDTLFSSFIDTNLIHNSYINYIKLNASTCFERHPLILRRSMSLIARVCSLWYSHSLQVAVLNPACFVERPPAENENTRGCTHVQLTTLTSWGWADDARNM